MAHNRCVATQIAQKAVVKTPIAPIVPIRDDMISHSPVKLIDEVILRANSEKASDIHIEPFEHLCQVRIRVDGGLVLLGRYKKEIHEEAVARLKVLSSLRTDVRMAPQDGRFKVSITGAALNIRLSIVPSFFGEKCVLRLLPQTQHVHTLDGLGFSQENVKKIHAGLSAAHGMVLVVGPTGCGKTTTLYTLLQKIAAPDVALVTLEDPIENSLLGVTQIPIHGNGHITFASALRAVVRQDPDVIMVGEIRDTATAELSTHAALTGHLVLSTLHTNDAVMTLPRLIEMGVEPFLVASTVRMIISQRLVRKICMKCIAERKITASEIEFLEKYQTRGVEFTALQIKHGRGCAECRHSGYSGRLVVSEVLLVDERIREGLMQKCSPDELRKKAEDGGMCSLVKDGIEKILQGKTTFEEIALICQH